MKWRLTSIISPRQGNRGLSSIVTVGTLKPWGVILTSCRNVCKPWSVPNGFAAVNCTCVGETFR